MQNSPTLSSRGFENDLGSQIFAKAAAAPIGSKFSVQRRASNILVAGVLPFVKKFFSLSTRRFTNRMFAQYPFIPEKEKKEKEKVVMDEPGATSSSTVVSQTDTLPLSNASIWYRKIATICVATLVAHVAIHVWAQLLLMLNILDIIWLTLKIYAASRCLLWLAFRLLDLIAGTKLSRQTRLAFQ
jgi:hypothetical protein